MRVRIRIIIRIITRIMHRFSRRVRIRMFVRVGMISRRRRWIIIIIIVWLRIRCDIRNRAGMLCMGASNRVFVSACVFVCLYMVMYVHSCYTY